MDVEMYVKEDEKKRKAMDDYVLGYGFSFI